MTKKKESNLENYEVSIKQVEEIVTKLRDGKLSLDESLKQYEAGVKMVKDCMQTIESMEKRVTLIVEKEGTVQEKPFE
jgi:exodeoxyribonuclease VII small subunit